MKSISYRGVHIHLVVIHKQFLDYIQYLHSQSSE